MKRTYLLPLISLIAVFLLINVTYAIPYIYTFEGTLNSFAGDAGIIAANGLEIGSHLSYNILIDLDRPGSQTLNDGTVTTYPLASDTPFGIRWVFYADYLNGSALQVITSGVAEDNRLVSWNMPNEEGMLYLNNNNTSLLIEGCSSPISWMVGNTDFLLYNFATESDGSSVQIRSGLTLTGISPVPAPEPSTLFLFASGFAGCAVLQMRRKCKK